MKILFDQNMPWGLRKPLDRHQVSPAWRMGWAAVRNGDLLTLAEDAGFELFLTGDKNLRYQQNLSKRKIAIVELSSTQWPDVRLYLGPIIEAVDSIVPGNYRVVYCGGHPAKRLPERADP